jgi:hypothetical protein
LIKLGQHADAETMSVEYVCSYTDCVASWSHRACMGSLPPRLHVQSRPRHSREDLPDRHNQDGHTYLHIRIAYEGEG